MRVCIAASIVAHALSMTASIRATRMPLPIDRNRKAAVPTPSIQATSRDRKRLARPSTKRATVRNSRDRSNTTVATARAMAKTTISRSDRSG